ncbi:unnamed protein product [Closterium sp. NIES-65]|nr:unnamed protein product [Closterium sp. NIES-65]
MSSAPGGITTAHSHTQYILSPPPLPPQPFRPSSFQSLSSLGLLYCAVPKAACTSWKIWFRQQRNDSDAHNARTTHLPARSHLPVLWFGMTEPEAIRAVTRRDLVRFVFVRDPFSRVVSAFVNKHVQAESGGWGKRRFWSLVFFQHLFWTSNTTHRPLGWRDLLSTHLASLSPFSSSSSASSSSASSSSSSSPSHPSTPALSLHTMLRLQAGGKLSFEEFMALVEAAREADGEHLMDNHIAPQVIGRTQVGGKIESLLCGLNHIKYHFVGRFERMERDMPALMALLGRQPGDAFAFGKSVHFTNSSHRLSEMFRDKETYMRVKRVYSMDMRSSLNRIHYEPPPELATRFEAAH